MAKIIVAAPPIPGEVGPLLQVARALADRGHRITVLSGPSFRAETEDAGLAFAPLGGDADYDVREISAVRGDGLPPDAEELNHGWIRALVDPMPDEHRALQALLEEDPDQYLISSVLFLGLLPIRYGVPGRQPRGWVGVSVIGLAITSEDATFYGPVPLAGDENAVKVANRAANAVFAEVSTPTRERLRELLLDLGAAEPVTVAWPDVLYTAPDAVAALTVPGFEFHRGDLPGTIHLVGALPPLPARSWDAPAWWADLDGSRPVVVVVTSQLVEPTLLGLADRDVTVVAALGGADPESLSIPLPANARVASHLPFEALLPRTAVLITDGGIVGIQQALAAGVPVIVGGDTEDQPANATRVAHHQLGVDLRTGNPAPEAVARAVTEVLGSPDIRENVTRLAKVYAQHDPIEEIERLAVG
ncbi:nucleotide disphospho-sugar-binding domain-containing protein [Actinoplanes sp. M2I2]|uniref:nucleotide disphospho-sugar-binding domain-containing protein n=1 Tax=Actinoplanes sp. M2I2 TaxID=1734444 RepID=UPI0020225014|nr:nucleotide disphospho-sugar-binding domain-containing protein [Actinoplanes sp. M2I2]